MCFNKQINNEGFIITAYLADKIKKGNTIWKKIKKSFSDF